MKKKLITSLFTAVVIAGGFMGASVALAAGHTITLQNSGCFGALRQCYNVNNVDESAQTHTVNIVTSPSYPSVFVTLDGIQYSSPAGMNGGNGPFNVVLIGPNGEQLSMENLVFSHTTRYVSSGRAHYYVTTWKVVSGMLVTQ